MRLSAILAVCALTLSVQAADLQYPKIKGHGGVFAMPEGATKPRPGSQVAVDVTASGYEGGVNKGLDRAARFLNLLTLGGDDQAKMAIVLHGGATREALSDTHYQKRFGKPNPNRKLLRQFVDAGVEVVVCGQSMTHNGFDVEDRAPEVGLALSAATALITLQRDGYSYLPVN